MDAPYWLPRMYVVHSDALSAFIWAAAAFYVEEPIEALVGGLSPALPDVPNRTADGVSARCPEPPVDITRCRAAAPTGSSRGLPPWIDGGRLRCLPIRQPLGVGGLRGDVVIDRPP
jgi:hypothetical protein